MVKLSTTETYDVSQIASTNAYSELETFIDYQIDATNDLVLALGNNLTVTENMVSSQFSLAVAHGAVTNIPYSREFTVTSIKSITPIRSYSIYRTTVNTVNLIVYFDQPLAIRSDQALWQSGNITRYRIPAQNINFKLGDFVTFAGFGTATNNGTFQIVDIDTTSYYLYVTNRKRTSATGDETRTSFAGTDNEKISITITFVT